MADRYWVGGTGTWNSSLTTNWAATSGGTAGASAPTLTDNVFFDANSNVGTGAFTVTITGNSGVCNDCTISGLDGVLTLTVGGVWKVYGSVSFPATNLTFAGASGGPIQFSATTTGKTITTNGVTLTEVGMYFDGVGGGWTLQDDITTTGTSAQLRLLTGSINLNNKTITVNNVTFGTAAAIAAETSSTINITGFNTGVLSSTGSLASTTVSGTLDLNFTYSGSVGTRSCIFGSGGFSATAAPNINMNITAGSDTFQTNVIIGNLNFTGFSGSLSFNSFTLYGSLTISAGMTITSTSQTITFGATSGTKTITTNGKTLNCVITFDGVGGTFQLVDNLTVGTSRTVTLTNGTLDLNSKILSCGAFDSNNSNTRTLAFGVGTISITGASTTLWNTTTVTGLTVTGTAIVNVTNNSPAGTTRTISGGSGISETNAFSFNITAGSDNITTTANHSYKDLNFTGFSGIFTNTNRTIYGNLTLSSTMTCASAANITTFAATSGTKTITTNGVTTDFPITFDGVGGTWQLVGNLTMVTAAARTLTLTNGTFNASGYNVTVGTFSSNNSNIRALQMGGGIWTVIGSGASTWLLTTTTNMTLTHSNSIIDLTSTTAKTFAGGGLSYGTLKNTGSGTLTVTGANTFANLRGTANITLTSSTTTTVTDALSMDGRYGSLVFLTSSAAANATISKASGKVYTTFCNISKITATGGATFRAPATPLTSYGNVDGGTNSGWTFTAMGATDNPNPGAFSSFFS